MNAPYITHTHMQEKSRLDWVSYKRDEGLEEELSQHKKDGYECLATVHREPPGQWGTLTSCMCAIDILPQHSKESVHNIYKLAYIQAVLLVHVPATPTATWRDKSFFNELTSDNLNWNDKND